MVSSTSIGGGAFHPDNDESVQMSATSLRGIGGDAFNPNLRAPIPSDVPSDNDENESLEVIDLDTPGGDSSHSNNSYQQVQPQENIEDRDVQQQNQYNQLGPAEQILASGRWVKFLLFFYTIATFVFMGLFIHCVSKPPTPPPPPENPEVGQWETVVPEDRGASRGELLGLQTVHAILLPTGRLLISPGSSWRNAKNQTDVYDQEQGGNFPPKSMGGLFRREDDPFHNNKLEGYYKQVNNAAIYDPVSNDFFRVPHPVPVQDPKNKDHFIPSDLFCGGQIQLPDGNALFMGGTQYYVPFFSGTNAAFVYNWIEDAQTNWTKKDWAKMPEAQGYDKSDVSDTPWYPSGLMGEGRWYPTAIPLMDGRMVIFGGFKGFHNISTDPASMDMFKYEMAKSVDFFDYRKFNPLKKDDPWEDSWTFKDLSLLQNSPFTTELPVQDRAKFTQDCSKPSQDVIDTNPADTPSKLLERQCESYKYDTFKLYPRSVLLPDGHRIFISSDGDYNSLRDPSGMYMRNSKFTYIMDIGTEIDSTITFQKGPELAKHGLNARNMVRDPNDNKRILFSGGMELSGGYYAPGLLPATDERCNINGKNYDKKLANHYIGLKAERGSGIYTMPSTKEDIGSWDEESVENDNFLGYTNDTARTMHFNIILPTKQLLVIAGSNYWFAHGVQYPLLYTPKSDGKGYTSKRLALSTIERVYHNTAVLLADGRIFVAGGNANRASLDLDEDIASEKPTGGGQRKYNPKSADRDTYFIADGYLGRGHKPAPSEEWVAEIYSPPYLFIDPKRRTVIESLTLLSDKPSENFVFQTDIDIASDGRKSRHYLFKSNISIKMLLGYLPNEKNCKIEQGSLVLIKLGSATHGWDSGQQLFDIPIKSSKYIFDNHDDGTTRGSLEFDVPSTSENQIIPAFYHLFYVDCRGKPTVSVSVRVDDNVNTIKDRAEFK